MMEICFGQGTYEEKNLSIKGEINLSEHKLFLKDRNGDLTKTYIALDRIEKIKKIRAGLEFFIRPTLYFQYAASIKGNSKEMARLLKMLVSRRGLKKVFLKNEWVDEAK